MKCKAPAFVIFKSLAHHPPSMEQGSQQNLGAVQKQLVIDLTKEEGAALRVVLEGHALIRRELEEAIATVNRAKEIMLKAQGAEETLRALLEREFVKIATQHDVPAGSRFEGIDETGNKITFSVPGA